MSQTVTPTFMKILHKNTNIFIFQQSSFQKAGRRAKEFEVVVSITPNYFPFNFLTLQPLYLNTTPKYFKFPNLPKFQTMYQLGHVF
jgi:hypothetical protein